MALSLRRFLLISNLHSSGSVPFLVLDILCFILCAPPDKEMATQHILLYISFPETSIKATSANCLILETRILAEAVVLQILQNV